MVRYEIWCFQPPDFTGMHLILIGKYRLEWPGHTDDICYNTPLKPDILNQHIASS